MQAPAAGSVSGGFTDYFHAGSRASNPSIRTAVKKPERLLAHAKCMAMVLAWARQIASRIGKTVKTGDVHEVLHLITFVNCMETT